MDSMSRIAILLLAAVAACADDAPIPTCADLGCEVALCTRSGECTCTPPGEKQPEACTAGFRS